MSRNDEEMISSPLLESASAGCEESQMLVNRRALLGVSAGLFSWACMPRSASATTSAVDPNQRRLLVVVLRGALDGLHVAYRRSEATKLHDYRSNMFNGNGNYLASNYAHIASVPQGLTYSIRAENGTSTRAAGSDLFMLHNKMLKFREMYRWREAILVHAIAPPLRIRSHFDCQANLESGQPGLRNINNEGWLNRFVQGVVSSDSTPHPMTGTLAINGLPLILKGAAPVKTWSRAIMQDYGDSFLRNKMALDFSSKPAWKANLEKGVDLDRQIFNLNSQLMPLGLNGTGLTMPFSAAGMLMAKDDGPRIAVLSVEGLDTHTSQIQVLDRKLQEIDSGLSAFRTAMRITTEGKAAWNETVVVCVTEFGRTVQDNASGTDHGVGSVAFLVGGNVNGSRILTDWPTIASNRLMNNALTPTVDTRALFRGLLRDHMGCDNKEFLDTTVFPGTTDAHAMSGLVKSVASGLSIKPSSAWARA